MPDEPEVAGLLALMLLIDSRCGGARTGADGALVPLAEQDRGRWDRDRIAEGQTLVRACLRRNQPGPYQIQAAINAVHSDAPTAAATSWPQILRLYDQLMAHVPSPVVALHRAVAVAGVTARGSAAAGRRTRSGQLPPVPCDPCRSPAAAGSPGRSGSGVPCGDRSHRERGRARFSGTQAPVAHDDGKLTACRLGVPGSNRPPARLGVPGSKLAAGPARAYRAQNWPPAGPGVPGRNWLLARLGVPGSKLAACPAGRTGLKTGRRPGWAYRAQNWPPARLGVPGSKLAACLRLGVPGSKLAACPAGRTGLKTDRRPGCGLAPAPSLVIGHRSRCRAHNLAAHGGARRYCGIFGPAASSLRATNQTRAMGRK